MSTENKKTVEVATLINAPIEKVFRLCTTASDIEQWNFASPDWHTPKATLDFKEGGAFNYRMEAKDGSIGFDLKGTFDKIVENETLAYTLEDGRKVHVHFTEEEGKTKVVEIFEPEAVNPVYMQQMGWQAILDNFRRYCEK